VAEAVGCADVHFCPLWAAATCGLHSFKSCNAIKQFQYYTSLLTACLKFIFFLSQSLKDIPHLSVLFNQVLKAVMLAKIVCKGHFTWCSLILHPPSNAADAVSLLIFIRCCHLLFSTLVLCTRCDVDVVIT